MTERKSGFQPETPTGEHELHTRSSLLLYIGGLARALGKTTLTIALILLIAFLTVWYATPYYLRDYLNRKGEGLPDYHLHIDWVQIHPWNCSIDIETVRLTKNSAKIPVPFFTCPVVHVAMQWEEILHGSMRSSISLIEPVVNFVQGPTPETSQTILEPEWVTAVKKLVPLRINRFTVTRGDIHFYDFMPIPGSISRWIRWSFRLII